MKTIITSSVKEAAKYIRKGDVAAFPTETVYGLGANAFDERAIKKIFKAKGRPADNPLIVHVAKKSDIKLLAVDISEFAGQIIKQLFPGPVTIIVQKNEVIPDVVTAGLDTIAIRMPASKIARDFIKECGVPIAAPSANTSGSPSPTRFQHVLQDFHGKIPCILLGPDARHGLESTVIDCTGEIPEILRPGVVTLEQLKKIDRRVRYKSKSNIVKSPGTKYRHYSPKAKVKIVESYKVIKLKGSKTFGYIGLDKGAKKLSPLSKGAGGLSDKGARSLEIRSNAARTKYMSPLLKGDDRGLSSSKAASCLVRVNRDLAAYAKNLFSFFRECDALGIKTIYCERVDEKGIGLAIMNRLKKAAS